MNVVTDVSSFGPLLAGVLLRIANALSTVSWTRCAFAALARILVVLQGLVVEWVRGRGNSTAKLNPQAHAYINTHSLTHARALTRAHMCTRR